MVHSSYTKVYKMRETSQPEEKKADGSESDDSHDMAKHDMMLDVASAVSK